MSPPDDYVYVINGFYAQMRSKYTAPGSSIYYFSVKWDSAELSWSDFRGAVLGATDPETAASGSMRREILSRWESLGLASKPNVGDNGVHASASPFEGVAERLNWLGATLDDDDTGHAFLEAGVKRDTLLHWTKDPQVDVDGKSTSLFDSFEDLDVGACLKTAQKLGGDPFEDPPKFSTNQAFMFLKPHANNVAVRALVKTALRERNISVVDEGEIDAVTILSRKLIGARRACKPAFVLACICSLLHLLSPAFALACICFRLHLLSPSFAFARIGLRFDCTHALSHARVPCGSRPPAPARASPTPRPCALSVASARNRQPLLRDRQQGVPLEASRALTERQGAKRVPQ